MFWQKQHSGQQKAGLHVCSTIPACLNWLHVVCRTANITAHMFFASMQLHVFRGICESNGPDKVLCWSRIFHRFEWWKASSEPLDKACRCVRQNHAIKPYVCLSPWHMSIKPQGSLQWIHLNIATCNWWRPFILVEKATCFKW